jgi:hypothetical protein
VLLLFVAFRLIVPVWPGQVACTFDSPLVLEVVISFYILVQSRPFINGHFGVFLLLILEFLRLRALFACCVHSFPFTVGTT